MNKLESDVMFINMIHKVDNLFNTYSSILNLKKHQFELHLENSVLNKKVEKLLEQFFFINLPFFKTLIYPNVSMLM